MGQHRHNPRALAAAAPRSFRVEPKQPDVTYGFQLEMAIEPNAECRKRLAAEEQLCREAGAPAPVYRMSDFGDEDKDVVVYKTYGIARTKTPGGLDLQQPVTTAIRVGEFDRRPLTSLLNEEAGSLQRLLGPSKPLIEG